MPVVAVVGPNQEDGHFGRFLEIELAIPQVPENLFRAIPVMPQVDGMSRREVPFPYAPQRLIFAAQFTEGMRDGIANQHEVIVTRPDRRDLFRMARARCRRRKIGATRFG